MAAQVQANSLFCVFETPFGSRLWSARTYWTCYALNRTAINANVGDRSPFEMHFVLYYRARSFSPGYKKNKRQGKLRPKASPCIFVGPSANRPRDTYYVLLNSGSVVDSRNVTWARLPPPVPVSVENVRSVSVSRNVGKFDPRRHGGVEEDEYVDCDESSESNGVRSRVTARLVALTPAAVPCGRAAPAGGRGTAAATSLRSAAIKETPGTPGHSSAGTPRGFAMSTPPATSVGVNASGGTVSPGVSVESSPSVSEEDEVDDSPSPSMGGRADSELKWLGETPVVRQTWIRGEQRQLDLNSAALFVEK